MTSADKKSNKFKHILKYLLSIILAVVFLYIAFIDVDFKEVLHIVSNASIVWILIFIVVMMSSHYVRALRWKVILNSVKPDTSIKNLFGAIMVGYGINCVVPRLGELSRAVLVGKWEGLSRSSMFGAVIVERVIDIIFLGLAVLVSVIIWSENLYDSFPWLKTTLIISMVLMAILILFFYLTVKFREKFYGIIIKILSHISEKFAHKTAYVFEMLTHGFASLKGAKNYTLTILLSVLIMCLYGLSSYVGLYTIGMQNIKEVSFEMGWIVMSISAIGVVIPTPGGTGSYHTLAKSTLVLLFGFGENISMAYAFLTHIISYAVFIFSALFVYFFLNKQHYNFFKIANTEEEKK